MKSHRFEWSVHVIKRGRRKLHFKAFMGQLPVKNHVIRSRRRWVDHDHISREHKQNMPLIRLDVEEWLKRLWTLKSSVASELFLFKNIHIRYFPLPKTLSSIDCQTYWECEFHTWKFRFIIFLLLGLLYYINFTKI